MDAKDAIKLLKGEPVFLNDFPEVKRKQAARLAVEALEKLPVLEAENAIMREALERLSRLGAGDRLGNSDGNCIAQQALREAGQAIKIDKE